jgi:hypothetical protein
MVYNIRIFYENGSLLLLGIGVILFVLAVWLIVEAIVRFTRIRIEVLDETRGAMIS